MEIGVLFDLLNEFFISNDHAGLDDQRTHCHAKGLCWRSKSFTELSRVIILQLIPRNELSQLDPAIVTREFAVKRQKEVFERELITMLTSVHVGNSGPLLGANEPDPVHFTRENCSYPLRRRGLAFLRRPRLPAKSIGHVIY